MGLGVFISAPPPNITLHWLDKGGGVVVRSLGILDLSYPFVFSSSPLWKYEGNFLVQEKSCYLFY